MAGIYIHVPFCGSRCIYCDFYSQTDRSLARGYADGILAELAARRNEISEPYETVYFGGGTPSQLPVIELARIIKALPTEHVAEFTVEVNPDDITANFVKALADLGVNRISMGVQSLQDEVLRLIRRRHTASGALRAIETVQQCGIENVSADLIYGLSHQTQNNWEADLRRIISAGIAHLSAYCLTFYEGTLLSRMMASGEITPASDDELADRFCALRQIASAAGFHHYEISNLAMRGREARHNSSYWSLNGRWLGLGPAAVSFDGAVRRANPADIRQWIASLPNPAVAEDESLIELLNDHIVAALRTDSGIDLDAIPAEFACGILSDARRFIDSGDMLLLGSNLSINPDRWLIADAFIREMLR